MNTPKDSTAERTPGSLHPVVRSAVKCTLEENINRAAAELPDGWIIEINVEAGAGWVDLYDGCGNSVDVSGAGSINEQVSEAISYAREHS